MDAVAELELLEKMLSGIQERLDSLTSGLLRLEKRVKALSEELEKLKARIKRLEEKCRRSGDGGHNGRSSFSRISETDLVVLRGLVKLGGKGTVKEIAEITGKSRSTVGRSLLKLLSMGIVSRRPYVNNQFIYELPDRDELMKRIREYLQRVADEEYKRLAELVEKVYAESQNVAE